MLLSFTVYGLPAPQGSKARGRHGNLYDMSRGLGAWRSALESAARKTAGPSWEPLDIPVVVGVDFFLPRPAATKFPDYPAVPPDLDKLVRAVGDGLKKGGVLVDDARIVRWIPEKHWAIGRDPGADIRIYDME